MTNGERAMRASAALDEYCWTVGDSRNAYSEHELVTDILCDLMHYAKSVGVSFSYALETGIVNFEAECDEESEDSE